MSAPTTTPAGTEGEAVPAGVTLTPGSPEWMQVMTASKVAAVLGLSRYESRFSLYHRMANLIPAEPATDTTRRGHYLEPAVAAWFADQHPEWTVELCGTFYDDDRRFAAAPDRLIWANGDPRVLEIKTATDYDHEYGTPGTDEIPPSVRTQVVWQMMCSRTRTAHIAVLTAGLVFAEYVVMYDPDEADYIRQVCEAFLDSLPTGTNPQRPDLDAHGATYEAVKALHPEINGEDVQLESDLVDAYCRATHDLKAAKTAESLAKTRVADEMGNAKRALLGLTTIATRQARGEGTPYVVAGRNIPHPTQEPTP